MSNQRHRDAIRARMTATGESHTTAKRTLSAAVPTLRTSITGGTNLDLAGGSAIWLGTRADGTGDVILDWDKDTHWVISGDRKTGKTSLLRALHETTNDNPAYRLYGYSPDPVTGNWARDMHAALTAACENELGSSRIEELTGSTEADLGPRVLVLIDNIERLSVERAKKADPDTARILSEVDSMVERLLRMGRSYGVHVVLAGSTEVRGSLSALVSTSIRLGADPRRSAALVNYVGSQDPVLTLVGETTDHPAPTAYRIKSTAAARELVDGCAGTVMSDPPGDYAPLADNLGIPVGDQWAGTGQVALNFARNRHWLVSGYPGFGKTHLLRRLRAALVSAGGYDVRVVDPRGDLTGKRSDDWATSFAEGLREITDYVLSDARLALVAKGAAPRVVVMVDTEPKVFDGYSGAPGSGVSALSEQARDALLTLLSLPPSRRCHVVMTTRSMPTDLSPVLDLFTTRIAFRGVRDPRGLGVGEARVTGAGMDEPVLVRIPQG